MTHWLIIIVIDLKCIKVSQCVFMCYWSTSHGVPACTCPTCCWCVAGVTSGRRQLTESRLLISSTHTTYTLSFICQSINQSISRSIFCSSTRSLYSFLLLFVLCEYKQEVIILLLCFRSHMTISWWHHNEVTRGHWATAEGEVQITSCLLRVVFLYCVLTVLLIKRPFNENCPQNIKNVSKLKMK